jgi:5-methylcytosine-specific restriction endonuclease McrA
MSQSRPRFRARGYTREWDVLAADFKRRNLWCVCCWAAGARNPTVVVDHIVPLADAPERLLDSANLQALCRDCHDTVKRELERLWRVGRIKVSDLDARSVTAYALHRKLHRPAIGIDGYATPGT